MAKLYTFVLAAALAGLTACSKGPEPVAQVEEPLEVATKPVGERSTAPPFALKDSHGATATLDDYKGKVLLLNFWATWCVPCKAEIPWFQEFDKNFKDKGFAVLGVSLDEEGWDVVKPYVEERKINYRMVIGSEEVSVMYGGIASLPTTFLIDQEGKIAAIHTGLVSKATYQKEIEDLLNAKSAAVRNPGDGQLAFFRAPRVPASVRAE